MVFEQAKKHYRIAGKVPKVTQNLSKMSLRGRKSEPRSYHSKGNKKHVLPTAGKSTFRDKLCQIW